MKRRGFLKKSAVAAPLMAVLPSMLTSACGKDEPVDASGKSVIVIGAGISGLAAAKKLKERGFQVNVLEAQNSIGGRTKADRSLGFAFDMGASWIHGVNGNPITALAEKAGMETFFTDDSSLISYDIGAKMRNSATYFDAEDAFYNILETMMNKGSDGLSFETVFKANYPDKYADRLWRFFLSTYVTFDCGDLDKLSSTLYDEGEEFSGVEKIATNGYDTIAQYLSKDLNIILNERVNKIEYAGEKVKVHHNSGITEADYAIVTVPLGVLKAGKITFEPALSSIKNEAIQGLGMNCVNKFVLLWENAFWDNMQYIVYTPEQMDKFNYFVNIKKAKPTVNALMTFAYAEYARKTETMTDSQVIDEIMQHLRDIYGSGIPMPIKMLRTRWASDENTFGAYSYTSVNTKMRYFDDLADEVADKLFFAGEHTEADYFSTAHGAYISGIREADKIIDLL